MLVAILLVLAAAAIWSYMYLGRDRLREYKDALGLEKANMVYASDYRKVQELILPARESAFAKAEPVVWLLRNDEMELFLGANQNGDVRLWLQPQTVLKNIHIVLDGTLNNHGRTNLRKDKLPKQQIALEGNFPEHFKLYCNKGQQVIALQVIAPDTMAYLLDNLLSVDVEIIGDQVAILVKGGAKTLGKLKASIELAGRIHKLTSATTKVTKLL